MKNLFYRTAFPPPSAWARGLGYRRRPAMGQDPGDLDVASLREGVVGLLDQVPEGALGAYQAELDRCERLLSEPLGIFTGGRCMYKLFQDLKDVVRDAREGPAPPPARPPVATPPSSGFPILPVAIAAAAGLALVYAVTQSGG